MLKKICINIPFAEALSQMPLYAKFLKDIFSKKRKIEYNETITLTLKLADLTTIHPFGFIEDIPVEIGGI